jgi:predicted GNAT superfamily acetyltransferase
MSAPRLLDATVADYPAILALNAAAVPNMNEISEETLRRLHQDSCYLRVAKTEDCVVAFLLALPEGTAYGSPNYRWFSERYPAFVYIDRVVVDPAAHRRGVGRLLYQDLEAVARSRAPLLACEVNLRPANPGSVLFHESLGFEGVGEQETEGGAKRVLLMVKPLSRD